MRNRNRVLSSAVLAASVGLSAPGLNGAGQRAAVKKPAASVPRLADGHPDLQGTYDLATLAPVERRAGMPLVLSDGEAARLEQEVARRTDILAAPIKGDRDAPPKGGDGSPGPYGNGGGYNNFWLDPGSP